MERYEINGIGTKDIIYKCLIFIFPYRAGAAYNKQTELFSDSQLHGCYLKIVSYYFYRG